MPLSNRDWYSFFIEVFHSLWYLRTADGSEDTGIPDDLLDEFIVENVEIEPTSKQPPKEKNIVKNTATKPKGAMNKIKRVQRLKAAIASAVAGNEVSGSEDRQGNRKCFWIWLHHIGSDGLPYLYDS